MENEEGGVTLTNEELKAFIDALKDSVVRANMEAMNEVFNAVMPPILQRIENVAQGQITLATALKTNRRDAAALEFAKLLIERAMRTDEGIDPAAMHTIPALAYALASEMDLHGKVAEVQADSKTIMHQKHIETSPHSDPKTLVDSFFGRGAKPKADKGKH